MSQGNGRARDVPAAGVVLTWMLLAWCPGALALDPTLDVGQYAHTSWKVREGFFKDSIGCIAQTPDGYLWLGTQFGIVRFDGVRHVPWQPPAGQQLPSSYIRSLFAARDGRLWIGTWLGPANWKDGKLTQYPELAGQSVSKFIEDHEGTVWAGTRSSPGKLCAFRSGSVQCYGEGGEFGDRASTLHEDRAGNLWVGAHTGLWRWKPGPPKLYPFPDIESSQGVVESSNGALVIVMRSGLKQLINEKVVAWSLPTEGVQPSRVLRDRDGGLWIGTLDRGLVHVHQGRMDLFSQSDGLSGNYIRYLFEDREGNIWVATDNGLDRFRHVTVSTISVNRGLSQAAPWSLLAAGDGSVWVGTVNGLNRLKEGHVTVYRKRSNVARRGSAGMTGSGRLVREITDAGLPDNLIHSLFEDDGRRIWVSTHAGVAYFENDRFIPVDGIPGGVHAIAGDAAGNIWISEDRNLFHVRGGRVVEQIPWAKLGRTETVIPMLWDPVRGGLWLGASRGLYPPSLDARGGPGLEYFQHGQIRARYGAADGLGQGIVGGLHLDASGTLWVATEGGLSRLKGGRFHTLTTKNGLPCDGIHWVIEDDDHAFWLYTACGLARLARSEVDAWIAAIEKDKDMQQRVKVTVFDNSDGVRIHAAPGGYTPRVGKSPDGRIWFLPWDGVSVIDPRRLPVNNLPPPVHIEQITADGKTYDVSHRLRLPPFVRDLTIDYTALSLVAPEKVRFRYKLEGQDPDWKEVVNERRAYYSNLAPRSYRFRVAACNNSGVWNETGDTLEFSVAPAYYQTNWFKAASAGVLVLLFWAAYRFRVRQLQREFKKLRDVIDTIPAMAWTARPDGTNLFVNRRWAEYTGLGPEEEDRDGSGWIQAVHPEDRQRSWEMWRIALASGEPFEHELRFRAADGQYRWFLTRAVPLHDERGKILSWCGIVTDIEDRRRAEAEREKRLQLEADLSHINRVSMMGELAASIAHEVNQPLAGVVSNASAGLRWLAGISPNLEEAREGFRRIVRDGKRAGDVIVRIRALTRRAAARTEKLDLNQTILEVLALVGDEAKKTSVMIR
ncbi:MAG TPA: two-component regulator propeller domain-containing protein, partial [Bryobacteraceae bacterium]|nr:two-component regulator propeller domain-containing protein [Bryobacteraceae bacterium]